MFSTLTLSYSECVLVPQLNLIACILLCCLKCTSCTEIHVVNIIIHSQSVKYLFVSLFQCHHLKQQQEQSETGPHTTSQN